MPLNHKVKNSVVFSQSISTRMHSHTHTHKCVCIHTHTHTHPYAFTHTLLCCSCPSTCLYFPKLHNMCSVYTPIVKVIALERKLSFLLVMLPEAPCMQVVVSVDPATSLVEKGGILSITSRKVFLIHCSNKLFTQCII